MRQTARWLATCVNTEGDTGSIFQLTLSNQSDVFLLEKPKKKKSSCSQGSKIC